MIGLTDRLRSHVEALHGERCPLTSPEAHEQARDYVRAFLAGHGDVRDHVFDEGVNLILDTGTEPARIVIGAHYDTVPGSPGADDNASGIAVLLELVRRLREAKASCPVRFVAFDVEEWGMRGGAALAREMKKEGHKIDCMISLEMVGYRTTEPGTQRYPPFLSLIYPDTGDFIGLISNRKAKKPMKRLSKHLKEGGVRTQTLVAPFRGWLLPETRMSDHSPFWDRGFPAIMVTDTAWLRNPNYHGEGDTIETLDFDFMTRICMGLTTFLLAE